jgi:phosphoribosylglycinamide formyltransferase 1
LFDLPPGLRYNLRMTAPLPIACLVSGSGTNLQAIIDRIESGALDARIVAVVSNVPGAGALDRAHRHGIPRFVVDNRDYPSRQLFDRELAAIIERQQARLICLCGFLRIFSPSFIDRFPGRIINIHPALLPDFGGKGFYGHKVHEAVLAAGAGTSGCTVHVVDTEVDHGPIILQKTVPVMPGDTPATLAARVLVQEHLAYPEAIQLFANGRVVLRDGRAVIRPA